jgi:hypothetical protein
MSDTSRGILLAILAFLLGLVANQINRLLSREPRRLSYSKSSSAIVAVNQSLPEAVRQALPVQDAVNVYRHEIVAKNSGKKAINNVEAIIVPAPGTQIIRHEVTSTPARGVPYTPSFENGEVQVKQVSLAQEQGLRIIVFTRSDVQPDIEVYWTGGGEDPPSFVPTGGEIDRGVEGHLGAIIRNYIAAEVLPAVIGGVAAGLGGAAGFLGGDTGPIQLGAFGVGNIFSTLVRAYFLLRIVPHALALVRIYTERRSEKRPLNITAQDGARVSIERTSGQ